MPQCKVNVRSTWYLQLWYCPPFLNLNRNRNPKSSSFNQYSTALQSQSWFVERFLLNFLFETFIVTAYTYHQNKEKTSHLLIFSNLNMMQLLCKKCHEYWICTCQFLSCLRKYFVSIFQQEFKIKCVILFTSEKVICRLNLPR